MSFDISPPQVKEYDNNLKESIYNKDTTLWPLLANQYLDKAKIISNKYKDVNSKIQFLGGLPVTLEQKNINTIKRRINQNENKYMVGIKLDGERCLLFNTKENDYANREDPLNNHLWFLNRSIDFIRLSHKDSFLPKLEKGKLNNFSGFILDGELLEHDNKWIFFVFDILMFEGRSEINNLWKQRMEKMNILVGQLQTYYTPVKWFRIFTKPFYTYENIISNNLTFYKSVKKLFRQSFTDAYVGRALPDDGLIFQPIDTPYIIDRAWNDIDNIQFKWKEDNTIDFTIGENNILLTADNKPFPCIDKCWKLKSNCLDIINIKEGIQTEDIFNKTNFTEQFSKGDYIKYYWEDREIFVQIIEEPILLKELPNNIKEIFPYVGNTTNEELIQFKGFKNDLILIKFIIVNVFARGLDSMGGSLTNREPSKSLLGKVGEFKLIRDNVFELEKSRDKRANGCISAYSAYQASKYPVNLDVLFSNHKLTKQYRKKIYNTYPESALYQGLINNYNELKEEVFHFNELYDLFQEYKGKNKEFEARILFPRNKVCNIDEHLSEKLIKYFIEPQLKRNTFITVYYKGPWSDQENKTLDIRERFIKKNGRLKSIERIGGKTSKDIFIDLEKYYNLSLKFSGSEENKIYKCGQNIKLIRIIDRLTINTGSWNIDISNVKTKDKIKPYEQNLLELIDQTEKFYNKSEIELEYNNNNIQSKEQFIETFYNTFFFIYCKIKDYL